MMHIFSSNQIIHKILFSLFGRHSLMARPQDTVSIFLESINPCFEDLVPLFFISIIFKRESLGVTGGDRGHRLATAGAQLSNLQLVPGRDNIGDVGL